MIGLLRRKKGCSLHKANCIAVGLLLLMLLLISQKLMLVLLLERRLLLLHIQHSVALLQGGNLRLEDLSLFSEECHTILDIHLVDDSSTQEGFDVSGRKVRRRRIVVA